MCGDAKIVGDDDEGLAVFVLEAEHFVEDMLGEIAVERAGGVVGEDQIPGLQYASCEGDALLFTAGAAEVIAKSVFKAYTSNGATLSVLLYLRAFEDGDFASAWGIGAVLLVLVLAINLAARLAKAKLKQKQ